jgi:hypothetical protein
VDEESGEGDMIVMDRLGNTFIAPKERGVFHHSSFFSGQPLAFAGLCDVRDGKIQTVFVYSGHYNPTEIERDSFIHQFNTARLVQATFLNRMKMNLQENRLIEVVPISSKEPVSALFDLISECAGFHRTYLRIICAHHVVCDNQTPIEESPILANGRTFFAIEFAENPTKRIFPNRQFELLLEA